MVLLLGVWPASCSPGGQKPSAPPKAAKTTPSASRPAPAKAFPGSPVAVVENLYVPWGLDFLPGGDALVAERPTGRILRIGRDGKITRIATLDIDRSTAEGGLLGLAVSPRFRTDRSLYAYYTSASDNRVVRLELSGKGGRVAQPVVTGIPKGSIHDGGRIAFGPDGMLYIGTGETGIGALAQDRRSLAGKILRVEPDGSIPPGNPFAGSPVYSLGHRNVQGLTWDDKGRLYAAEFGPDVNDEINLIRPGRNYGWPLVTGKTSRRRFADPVLTFPPALNSASGAAIAGGALWTAALRGERLWRIPLQGDGTLGAPKAYFVGRYGRLRTVEVAPDGSLWVTTSNRDGRGEPAPHDDRILRVPLGPAEREG